MLHLKSTIAKGRLARFILTFCAVTVLASTSFQSTAQAGVFDELQRWPRGSDGLVTVPVCVTNNSDPYEGVPWILGLINGPDLGDLITAMQWAVGLSWSSGDSPIRFTGWTMCNSVSASQKSKTLAVNLHHKNSPRMQWGGGGYRAYVYLSPWYMAGGGSGIYGDHEACLRDTSNLYDCLSQYARHEFGHALGFQHETMHPGIPATCAAAIGQPGVPDGPTWPGVASSWQYVIGDSYDRESQMVYDSRCSNPNGRFGTKGLSAGDLAVRRRVYPEVALDEASIEGVYAGEGTRGELRTLGADSYEWVPESGSRRELWHFHGHGNASKSTIESGRLIIDPAPSSDPYGQSFDLSHDANGKAKSFRFAGTTFTRTGNLPGPADELLEDAIVCIQWYAGYNACIPQYWNHMVSNCKLEAAGVNTSYLYGEVAAGRCTLSNHAQIAAVLRAGGPPQSLDASLDCIGNFAERDECDWPHWSSMASACRTYQNGVDNEWLIPEVQAGSCTLENWVGLRGVAYFKSNPPQSFDRALDCAGAFAEYGICDWPHWSEMAATCRLPHNGVPTSAVFIPEVKAGRCTANNWSNLLQMLGG